MAGLSVGQLYAAAIAPGLLLAALYMVYIATRCGINPKLGPPMPKEENNYTLGQRINLAAVSLVPPMLLVLCVLGSILAGVATATEAAGIGCTGAFVLAIFYRKLTWTAVKDAATSTLLTTAMVMTLFVGGNAFQSIFMGLGGGDAITGVLLGMEVSPYVILFIMMGILFFLGMFIDWLGILLITLPIFTPIAQELGFNQVWFATLICVNLQMAFLTPPFGYSLFYLKGIAPPEMTIGHIYRGVVPFICLQWVAVIFCIFVPDFILWIPRIAFGMESVK
jgi:tripartite ATP-independent transporter DctM subunit